MNTPKHLLILIFLSQNIFAQSVPKLKYVIRLELMNTNFSNSSKNNILIAPNLNQEMFLLTYGNYIDDKTIFEIGITKLKHVTAFSEEQSASLAAIYAREFPRTFLYIVPRYRKVLIGKDRSSVGMTKSLFITNTSIWSTLGLGVGIAIPENNSEVTVGLSQNIKVIEDKKVPLFIGLEVGIEPTITINYRFDFSFFGKYYLGTPHRSLILDNKETINSSFRGWSLGVGFAYKFGLNQASE